MSLLPDWNSIESTARWSDVLFWAGIVCLILLAVTEVASHLYAKRSGELSDAAGRQAVASADAKAAQAQANADAVKRRQDQRSFTYEQSEVVVAAIASFRGQRVTIVCNQGDGEGRAFAEEFVSIFVAAHWQYGTSVIEAPSGDQQTGLQLQVSQPQPGRLFPAAYALATALQGIGWPHTGLQRSGQEQITVRVGRKPVYQ